MKLSLIYKYGLYSLCLLAGAGVITSCNDDIVVDSQYDPTRLLEVQNSPFHLYDGSTGRNNAVIEIYEETYTATVKASFSKNVSTTTEVKVKYEDSEAYLNAYNTSHGTNFVLFPKELVELDKEGNLTITPAEKTGEISVKLKTDDALLEEDQTYLLPITVQSNTPDVSDPKTYCNYLVKDLRKSDNAFKGEDVIRGCLFFEVNDVNPLNAFQYQLENGKYVWDAVVLFAANINYDSEAGRPRVQCNPNVQFLLDNTEQFLQPLRKRGIKVILGLLGNHDMTGLAQLSDRGAKDFAREVAQYCYAYKLDGVNFDDEYSKSPDLSNPALTYRSSAAGSRLCYETKKAMPDKMVTIYQYGSFYSLQSVDGADPSEFVDLIVPDYGAAGSPQGNITFKNCAGMAMEFARGSGGSLSATTANRLKSNGYGWYMGFSANPNNYTKVLYRIQGGMQTLYGSSLKKADFYYKKNDPNPTPRQY